MIQVTDHEKLIDFYEKNGLEFRGPHYVGDPILSFMVGSFDSIIGAVTVTVQNEVFVIDDLAVDINYRKQGIGKQLLEQALETLNSSYNLNAVYCVTKEPQFFLKMGFALIPRMSAPDFSICFSCNQYQKNCFPKTMVLFFKG